MVLFRVAFGPRNHKNPKLIFTYCNWTVKQLGGLVETLLSISASISCEYAII